MSPQDLIHNKLSIIIDKRKILIFLMEKMMINQICPKWRRLKLINRFWWCAKIKRKKISFLKRLCKMISIKRIMKKSKRNINTKIKMKRKIKLKTICFSKKKSRKCRILASVILKVQLKNTRILRLHVIILLPKIINIDFPKNWLQ